MFPWLRKMSPCAAHSPTTPLTVEEKMCEDLLQTYFLDLED